MSDEIVPTSDDRTWGALAHVSQFAGYAVPMGNILGPLVVYLMKKDQAPWVATHAKEALNFQITVTIGVLVSAVLSIVLIGIPLLIAIVIADLILTILAAVAAYNGQEYRYPATIRFVP